MDEEVESEQVEEINEENEELQAIDPQMFDNRPKISLNALSMLIPIRL